MTKKKSKGKTAAKKTAKKKKSPRKKKERNPAGVRNDIAKIVESGARKIARAVMSQAITGQLAPAKYLFEMAEIYPLATDGSQATAEEESLAKTLLRRLDLPEEPVVRDEEDPPHAAKPVEKAAPKPAEKGEDSAAAPEGGESKDSVVV